VSTIVYGGSLAALVAADQLAEAGEAVQLVTPSPHLGGHFAGVLLGGVRFDAGLVIFEYGALNSGGTPDPLSYDPDARNDCGRFGAVLTSYTESLGIALERVPAFRMWFDGARIPDFVFDTRLEGLRALPRSLREHARAELEMLVSRGEHPLHARRKYREPRYRSVSYEDASIANHGAVLHHSCLDPFARKVTGRPTGELLALYSRAAWLPLFWPETLLAALDGDPAPLPDIPFHVSRGGAVADVTAAIVARLSASPRVTHTVAPVQALSAAGDGIRMQVEGRTLHGTHLVWGHDVDELDRLITGEAGPAVTRAPVTIVLAQVPRADVADPAVGTLILPGDRALPYRIANQSTNAGTPDASLVRISVEWGGADAPSGDDALLAVTQGALVRTGITHADAGFVSHRILRIPKALVVPSASNRDTMLTARTRVEASGLPILPVAPAAGFGVASLSDQLVQGMKAARQAMGATARMDAAARTAAPAAA
jgi:hypothetical protein